MAGSMIPRYSRRSITFIRSLSAEPGVIGLFPEPETSR